MHFPSLTDKISTVGTEQRPTRECPLRITVCRKFGHSGSRPLLTPRGRTDLTWNTYNQSLAYRRHVIAGQDRVLLFEPVCDESIH